MNSIKKIKLVMLGDSGVGKSCIISRFMYNFFNEYVSATIGAQFLTKDYLDEGFRIDIWDTAGQERFRSLIPMYLRGANIIVVVTDATSSESIVNEQLDFWIDYIDKEMTGNYKKILIFNKLDLAPNFKIYKDDRFDTTIGTSCKMNIGMREFEDKIKGFADELQPYKYYVKKNIISTPTPTYYQVISGYIPSSDKCSIL